LAHRLRKAKAIALKVPSTMPSVFERRPRLVDAHEQRGSHDRHGCGEDVLTTEPLAKEQQSARQGRTGAS
jgi:hypothetical protein